MNGESLATAGFIAQKRALAIVTRGRIGYNVQTIHECISSPKLKSEQYPDYRMTSEVILND